jgi:hypothetical protein
MVPSSVIMSQGPSYLKRKNIMFDGKPHENVIFGNSSIKPIEKILEVRP